MENQSNQNDINQHNQENQQPVQSQQLMQNQNNSNGLGIASMVVGIVAVIGSWIPILNVLSIILGFVALGLAIGGIVVSRKGRPKGTSIAGLVLALATILIFFLTYWAASNAIKLASDALGSEVDALYTTSYDTASAETTVAETTADETDSAPEEYFKNNVLITNDIKIEITSYKIIAPGKKGNEYGDKPVIAFWYKTTNISGEKTNPTNEWIFSFELVQDNDPNAVNKLNIALLPDDKYRNSQLSEIKKNGTVENAVAYELTDLETPVTLIAKNSIVYGDEIGRQDFPVK